MDALSKYLTQDLGYSEGKPVAAFVIYKSFLHWRSFEAEKTSVFDRLIQLIGSAIEVNFLSQTLLVMETLSCPSVGRGGRNSNL